MSFYLTVNSDADRDDSTAGQFTTSFNNTVNLEDEYKVAVVNMSKFKKSSSQGIKEELNKNNAKAVALGVAKPPAEYPKCTAAEIAAIKAAYTEFNKTKDATYCIVTEAVRDLSFEFAHENERLTIVCFKHERITLHDLQLPDLVWESAHFVFQIKSFLGGMPIKVTAKKSARLVKPPIHFEIAPSAQLQKYLKLQPEIKFKFTE